uniref:Uncharacterized protein n=1 Tax=Solanum tuberosum TaxID=4113 RepID=M1DMF6_SOLTU
MTLQDESSGPLWRKREDVFSISFESSQKSKRHASVNVRKPLPSKTYPLAPQNPHPIQSNYQAPPPNYPITKFQAPARQNAPNYRQLPSPQQGHCDPPRLRFEKKPERDFTPLIEPTTFELARPLAESLLFSKAVNQPYQS